ncbi:Uncharacterized protein FWK35_00030774 [Aphis craccivora]|uniref:Uncharacterized protein n=1 Tax=Aphis craccivora TaxID=307492 RepID=A0A6G0VSH1_APHCR|nr:Uncharacterized protein FWK35_00030774 [Aphis craccivora]
MYGLASKIPFSKIKSETNTYPNSIFMEAINSEEIKLKINSLKSRTGSDNIDVKSLKANKESIATSMSELFNLFINTNYFPQQSKHAINNSYIDNMVYKNQKKKAVNHAELYQKANDHLIKVRNWLIENKFSLNISKTQYIDLSGANSRCIVDQELTFDT